MYTKAAIPDNNMVTAPNIKAIDCIGYVFMFT